MSQFALPLPKPFEGAPSEVRSPLISVSNAAVIFRDLRSTHTNWDRRSEYVPGDICPVQYNYVVTRGLHNDPDALMHDDLGSISRLLSNVLCTGAVQYFCLSIFIITPFLIMQLNPAIWRGVRF